MARQRRRPGYNPEHYHCANPECPRTTPLALKYYSIDGVPAETEPAHVHRSVDPSMPGFTLLCTCGHYTVVTAHDWHPPGA